MSRKNNLFKLDLLVLAVLYHGDCYGYEISNQIREKSNQVIDLKDGVLYPILYILMEGEYISSSEKQVGRKIRVYYHLLPKGSDLLLEMMKEYHDMVKSIDYILEGIDDE